MKTFTDRRCLVVLLLFSLLSLGGMLITTDMNAEDAQDIVDRDPYTRAGVAHYERLSFNGAYRAPGL